MSSAELQFLIARRLFEAGRFAEARDAVAALASDVLLPHVLHLSGLIAARSGALEAAQRNIVEAIELDASVPVFHQDLGNVWQVQGKLDRAIGEYRKAIRLDRKFALAQHNLGTAYYLKGWVDEALACYRKAIALDPGLTMTHVNLGSVLKSQGKYHEARAHFVAVLKLRLRDKCASLGKRIFFWRQTSPEHPGVDEILKAAEAYRLAGAGVLAEKLCREALRIQPAHLQSFIHLIRALESSGRLGQARETAESAVGSHPGSHLAHAALGSILGQLGEADRAESALREAIRLSPSYAKAWNNLGNVHLGQARFDAALAAYREAVHLDPENIDAWTNLGRLLFRQRQIAESESALRRALDIDPEHVGAVTVMVDLLIGDQRVAEAEAVLQPLAHIVPDDPDALSAFALLHHAKADPDAAIACLEEALRIRPGYWRAHNNLGRVLTDIADKDGAIRHLLEADRLQPDNLDVLLNLGRIYLYEGDAENARHYLERGLKAGPGSAAIHNSLGMLAHGRGAKEQAIAYFRRSVELDPAYGHAVVNLANTLVETGDLAHGWTVYEERLQIDENRPIHKKLDTPRWNGAPLDGKSIVVYPEQGLGDEIMFSSCIPEVLAQTRSCVVMCADKLVPIFQRSFASARVLGRGDGEFGQRLAEAGLTPELQVAMGSLPHYFRNSLSAFPSHQGYLTADSAKVQRWRERLAQLSPRPKVGLSWKGGVYRTGEARRTLSLEQLLPLLKVEGIDFVSLQYTNCEQDIEALHQRHAIRVHHWQEAIDDYDETAALVCELDLVVTVCTAIVHLSGALGRPVWVMAPFSPGWRYAMIPGGMPWYPSVRVFRQPAPGDWRMVLETVQARLRDWSISGAAPNPGIQGP